MERYPIARDGIFDTLQGEGVMSGVPMTFVRLAGCSVGCESCDTDYAVHERLSVAEIIERIQRLPRRRWVWVTGGEPTDHDVPRLSAALRREGHAVAMPTSGKRFLGHGWNGWLPWADHIYVSPHVGSGPLQMCGNELNVVPGLNGLKFSDVDSWDARGFPTKWVTPCDGKPESLAECIAWVKTHEGWRLGNQNHKVWKIA